MMLLLLCVKVILLKLVGATAATTNVTTITNITTTTSIITAIVCLAVTGATTHSIFFRCCGCFGKKSTKTKNKSSNNRTQTDELRKWYRQSGRGRGQAKDTVLLESLDSAGTKANAPKETKASLTVAEDAKTEEETLTDTDAERSKRQESRKTSKVKYQRYKDEL